MAVNATGFVDNILVRSQELGKSLIVQMNAALKNADAQMNDNMRQVLWKNRTLDNDLASFAHTLNKNVEPMYISLLELKGYEAAVLDESVSGIYGRVSDRKDKKAAQLEEEISLFLAKHFPMGNVLEKALATTIKLTEEQILKPEIENAIWQRDRARVLVDVRRGRDDILATFAARGFPLPPGAAAHMMRLTEGDAQTKIAQQSRDIAIKHVDMLLENLRIGAERLVQIQQAGISMLSDYLKSYLVLVDSDKDIEKMYVERSFELHRLKMQNIEVAMKLEGFYADQWLKFMGSKMDAMLRMSNDETQMRSDILETYSQQFRALGDMASSAYNAVHASASVSAVGETD